MLTAQQPRGGRIQGRPRHEAGGLAERQLPAVPLVDGRVALVARRPRTQDRGRCCAVRLGEVGGGHVLDDVAGEELLEDGVLGFEKGCCTLFGLDLRVAR